MEDVKDMKEMTGSSELVAVIDGQNALMYTLTATPDNVVLDAFGGIRGGSTISFEAKKKDGGTETAVVGASVVLCYQTSSGALVPYTNATVTTSTAGKATINLANYSSILSKLMEVGSLIAQLTVSGNAVASTTISSVCDGDMSWLQDDANINYMGEYNASARYYFTDARHDFVWQKIGSVIVGYMLKQKGNVLGVAPNASSGADGKWKIVAYTPVGFFGALIATLVRAETGDFNNLNAMYCKFEEVTIEGFINHLVQKITQANWSSHFAQNYLDPLVTGQMIDLTAYKNQALTIYLPCAFYDSRLHQNSVYGSRVNGDPITVSELRQCVGKKFYFLPSIDVADNTAQKIILRSGYARTSATGNKNIGMIVYRTKTYDDLESLTSDASTGSENKEYLQRVYEFQPSGPTYFISVECKMGMYQGNECIYWEVQASADSLE